MYRQRMVREMKKMFGYKKEDNSIEFYSKFRDTWIKSGGLISQATARRLLNRTKGRIPQMIKEGKLTTYEIEGVTYLSFAEVMTKAEKIQTKLARDKAVQELEKLGLGDMLNASLMKQFDEAMTFDPDDYEE